MKLSRGISLLVLTMVLASLVIILPAGAWDNLLQNPGFEDGTAGWQGYGGGTFSCVSSPVHSGSSAASLTSDSAVTKWIYQTVSIQGGESYTFSGHALKNDPDIERIFLRISWYESEDGFGDELLLFRNDSNTTLTDDQPQFRFLTTNEVAAPSNAHSARIKAILVPHSPTSVTAYFDDFSFEGPSPTSTPTSTPTPTLTPTPLPTPTSTSTLTPTPASTSTPTSTPTPTPTPASTSTPTSTPTPTPKSMPPPGPPSINEGDIVINEVQYDPTQGGMDAAFEWLELLNRTDRTIDLTGWRIEDNYGADNIPSLQLPPGGFAVVAAGAGFYDNFPSFSGDIVFMTGSSIGNGLSNTGDRLSLIDPTGGTIDALSYGDDTDIFSPSCLDVAEGHSLERQPAGFDTDQASDFVDNGAPTPGYGLSSATPTPSPVPTLTPAPTPTSAATSTATANGTHSPSPSATPGPALSPTPTPPSTQTPSPSANTTGMWLYLVIAFLLVLIWMTSLTVVFWRRRRG